MSTLVKPPQTVTTVSTKGQVVLPRALRDRLGWRAGDRLSVVDTPEGVLLRREPRRAPSRLEDVRGMLKWNGPSYSPSEVRAGAERAVAEKFARLDETGSAYGDEDKS